MARKRKDRWGDRISDLAFQQWMEILLRNTAKVEGEQVASEAARAILNINWPKQKVR